MNAKTKDTKELKCNHCKYIWNYTGKAPYYTSCPRCKASVNLISGQAVFKAKEVKE